MDQLSRRRALQHGAGFGVTALLGVSACGKSTPKVLMCTDTTGLSATDIQIRDAVLQYVEVSTIPGKNCANCQQFVPGAPDGCGTCKIVKGSINPGGNCKSFLAKAAV
jgi:high potential iron-sulfur protein